jgi:hypothetical protein
MMSDGERRMSGGDGVVLPVTLPLMVETPLMLKAKLLLSGVKTTSKVVAPMPLLSMHVASEFDPICRIACAECMNARETRDRRRRREGTMGGREPCSGRACRSRRRIGAVWCNVEGLTSRGLSEYVPGRDGGDVGVTRTSGCGLLLCRERIRPTERASMNDNGTTGEGGGEGREREGEGEGGD